MSGRPYIAASRGRLASGTSKAVSTMPSGSNSRSPRTVPSGLPETTSIDARGDVDADAVVPARARLEGERKLARSSIASSSGALGSNIFAFPYIRPTGESSRKW